MKINLSAYHPIADIRQNLIFATNGNLVLCYQLDLPEVYSLSERDFEDLHGIWFQALRSLPNGLVVHKQDVYTKERYRGENLPRNSFLGKATYDYFKGRQHLAHRSYLFFINPKNKSLNKAKYINPFKKVPRKLPVQLEQEVADFRRAVSDVVSFINNSKKIKVQP